MHYMYCSSGEEMMVIFIIIYDVIMLNVQMAIERYKVMGLLQNEDKHM